MSALQKYKAQAKEAQEKFEAEREKNEVLNKKYRMLLVLFSADVADFNIVDSQFRDCYPEMYEALMNDLKNIDKQKG